MAGKGLGMIHTVNQLMNCDRQDQIWTVDLSTQLSRQLQHQVRQGNYFKVVGIDMSLQGLDDTTDETTGGGQVSGTIRYWNPTRGRCAAYRTAFQTVMSAMKQQGLSLKGNDVYDFKVAFRSPADGDLINPNDSTNLATVDGSNPLCLIDSGSDHTNIFEVFNSNVMPKVATLATLTDRKSFELYGSDTDFVLNEALDGYFGNPNLANIQFEEIPFQLSFEENDLADDDTESNTMSFQWRPDPALYVAMMAGLVEIQFDALSLDGRDTSSLDIQLAIHVAGWNSIMGDPDKKPKRTRRKSHGKRKSRR